jgi:hypothetical protein
MFSFTRKTKSIHFNYFWVIYWIIYILKRFIPGEKLLTLYFLLTFKKNYCCFITATVGLRVPTKPIRDLSTINVSNVSRQPFNKVRHGCKQHLQISFSVNITSPFRIHFPLFISTELRHYRVACIILLPWIKF